MSPIVDDRTFAQVQARAFNAHDVDTIIQQAYPTARILRDGRLVGEGRLAMRRHLEAEYKDRPMAYARVVDTDRGPALAEFQGDENHATVRGVIRFKSFEGRVHEVSISHDADEARRIFENGLPSPR